MRHCRVVVGVFLLALIVTVLQPAHGADITVDATCTLAAAISAANLDSAVGGCTAGLGADTIFLTTDVSLTSGFYDHDGANGLPSVTTRVKIEGEGHTIWRSVASSDFRLVHVGAGGDLTLRNVSLLFGVSEDGGAIFNRGRLVLSNTTVSGNTASSSGGGLFLDHDSETRIDGSWIYRNYAEGTAAAWGGGIMSWSSLTIADSTLSKNTAISSGAGARGGALMSPRRAVLTNSTIADNLADGYTYGTGGGLNVTGATITNSTISGNSAQGTTGSGMGGGVYYVATIRNTTFSGNEASTSGAAVHLVDPFVEPPRLYGSLFANSTGNHCSGLFFVGDGNLADDDTCHPEIAATLAGLDPDLADNGGPTETHALDGESLAIGLAGNCGLGTDQRGAGREGDCDSGAYERIDCLAELEDMAIDDIHIHTLPPCHSATIGPDVVVEGPDGNLAIWAKYLVTFRQGFKVLEGGELGVVIGQ